MGHNTPTKVLAWTGEQISDPHKATASASFFTCYVPVVGSDPPARVPRRWRLPAYREPAIEGIYGTRNGNIADESGQPVDEVNIP
jgi:hypothetical protein